MRSFSCAPMRLSMSETSFSTRMQASPVLMTPTKVLKGNIRPMFNFERHSSNVWHTAAPWLAPVVSVVMYLPKKTSNPVLKDDWRKVFSHLHPETVLLALIRRLFLHLILLNEIGVIFSLRWETLWKISSFRFKLLLSLMQSSPPVQLPAVPYVNGLERNLC